MSGTFPRSFEIGGPSPTADPDHALCLLWDALEDGAEHLSDWDRTERVVNPLIDVLVEPGYLKTWGHSKSGHFWAISYEGHERLRALGRDA
jgi:hypothetical protein